MKFAVFTAVLLASFPLGYAQMAASTASMRQPPKTGESVLIALDETLSDSIKKSHLDGFMNYMEEDGAFLDGRGAAGKDRIREYVIELYGDSTFLLELKPTEAHRLAEYIGYTIGTYSLQGQNTRCGGCPVSQAGEYLLVWKRLNGEWKIKAWIPIVLRGGKGCGCGGGIGVGGGVFH